MNRHHPYGGGSFESPMRRGGPPSGPGPDRPQRFSAHNNINRGGRGGFRGRGGYNSASFDGSMSNGAYDQGPPTDPSMAPYSNYETGPPQDPYYQSNNYGAGPQFPVNPPLSAGYDQGFGNGNGNHEGSNFDDGFGRGAGRRPPVRKDRDDKVHDSIIEERIQRERPCRTLFIRNIKYETNSEDVRHQFEEHGEIKTFFDLISTRGMVFVTYYDLRAAERARDRLQGSEISGRPIDVHYSLPRDDHAKGGDRDKNQQLQGCLQVTLRSSPSGQPIDDNEVRHKFQQFGDVKAVKPVGDRPDSRYVEFYDTRACDEAYDRLRHQGLQDGVMDIVFAWDVNEAVGGQNHGGDDFRGGGRGRGNNRGNRGRGGGGGIGRGRGYEDDHRGGGDFGRNNNMNRGRFDNDYGPRGGGGGRGGPPMRGGYNNGYDAGPRGPGPFGGGYDGGMNHGGPPMNHGGPPMNHGGPPMNHGGPPMNHGGPPNYGQPPPPPPGQNTDERLEQARKVQALLAALKPPAEGGAPPAAAPPPPAAPPMQMQPPYYAQPPPGGMPPGGMPQPPYPGQANPYAMGPPPPQQPQPGQQPPAPNPAAIAGLPPHLLALLQQAQQQQQQHTPPPPPSPYGMPGMPGMPPQIPPPPNGNPQQYQQLLYHLRQQAGKPQ
ncbi:hypothetical protein C8F04DRAFT_159777 [Mycena alexandri]|uniref:RRM domain-containing protein n=1 Tax=Mycena alexandri TaxID=1745969 RepID=A0AAD6SBA0_9AGAR|nr:hypothetical protein C8F04DRAFT_159777 [Mycena alexandri]